MSTQIENESPKTKKKAAVKQSRPQKKKPNKALRRFRRWMTFLIFLGFAGFIAYTGWVQYDIPEGYGGLIHTKFSFKDGAKTGGFDEAITVHDGLHWRWEKLFPTNLTMHVYPLEIRTVTLSSQGTLPSGDIYLDYIGEQDASRFNWNISVSLSYRLKEESIPRLADEKGIFPEDLEEFFSEEEQLMEREMFGFIKDYSPEDSGTAYWAGIEEDLNRLHPFLEITSLAPESIIQPDLVLYEKARSLYFAYLDEKNRALEEMIARVAPRTTVNEEKMKVLEEYGKVLTEYPVLIDFFALDKNNDFGRFTPDQLMPEVLEASE